MAEELDQSWVWADGVDESVAYHVEMARWHSLQAIQAMAQRHGLGYSVEAVYNMLEPHANSPVTYRSSYKKTEISRYLTKKVFERDRYRCKRCHTWLDLTCDHIIPESKGGPTTLDNLQTLCRGCNSSKGART